MPQMIAEPASRAIQKKARSKGQILLIDDNKDLSRIIKDHLIREGYDVQYAKDGQEGLILARKFKPQLIILDIVMPKMDGMEFIKALRQESQTPVLILSGKHGDLHQVLGFKLGADDFVYKPICAEVLTARVEAIMKRAGGPSDVQDKSLRRLGKMTMDPERRELRIGGDPVAVTIKEFDLLKALIDARGKVLSRDQLLNTVWGVGEDCDIRTRTVDQHIAGVRQKLGVEGERIMTVPHFGYRIRMA
jgi:two-component system, OmpR family, response regulator